MYEYYRRQEIAPTFADLRDEEQLRNYARARETFLTQRLCMPPAMFRRADVLEFGPDTGENALVFARWGARLTLVEPNEAAFGPIRAYFERFGPAEALAETIVSDVLQYRPEHRSDVIVAEGFIHTIQPVSAWLRAFRPALVPGGLALVSFYERAAALFELSLKVPFALLRRREHTDRVALAERLYGPKWDRIPHTRSFSSWVMDLLDNPYQHLATFVDAETLLREASAAGFGLHATWPAYGDGLENSWGKRPIEPDDALQRTIRHVRRSVLSFTLGTKAYLVDASEAPSLREPIDAALEDSEALLVADDPARQLRLASTLRAIAARARNVALIRDDDDGVERALAALEAWAHVHTAFAEGRVDEAVDRLRSDDALLNVWGTPNHYAVLRLDRPTA